MDCLGAQSTIQVQGDIRCAGAFVNTGAAFEVRKRQVTRQRMALVDAAGISTWTTGIVNALILWTTRYMDAALVVLSVRAVSFHPGESTWAFRYHSSQAILVSSFMGA